ncbi:MerR family transcriptional regulator [Robertkochia flava]|uniref:MerR family transcriptional regulator n=1 Tax=Robertkochia flava TaxID=3447986 RepID=UPI001CCBA1BF|nr:MerR family transcriptional regulator [Robertkochia marina]
MHLNLPDKLYYSIGEVAAAFEVNTSLIRFWEKEFKEINPRKNAKGDRRFSKEDIETLQLIYHLVKERGFTLEGAKIHLREHRQQTLNNYEIIRKLESIKAELLKIKNQL